MTVWADFIFKPKGSYQQRRIFQRICNIAILIVALSLSFANRGSSHPTGNLVSFGDAVLWSYIDPIDDPDHHASVMIWDKISDPRIFLKSEHSASDYMLFSGQEALYVIERRYKANSEQFEVRLLKVEADMKPTVIWEWFADNWRIGESGFYMLSDTQMVFGRYPDILTLNKGSEPATFVSIRFSINKIRLVENGNILALSDDSCLLLDQRGNVLKRWDDLIDEKVSNPPLQRNQIFDADYKDGSLLIAYWGKRTFEYIDNTGNHKELVQLEDPLTPHWVASHQDERYLFASELVFDGSTPKPYLVKLDKHDTVSVVWEVPD
jgi:hypothetical protein